MNWTAILQAIIIAASGTIITYVFGKLGIDKAKFQRHQTLMSIAHMAVHWAADAFPDSEGVKRLNEAVDVIIGKMTEMGYMTTTAAADIAARAAYQEIKSKTIVKTVGN